MLTIRAFVVCWLINSFWAGGASAQQPAQFESLLASAQQAQARGDFESAARFYRRASEIHPEIAELKANLGLMYYQTGSDQPAIDSFLQANRLKPGLFVPNFFLGLEYLKLKRFNEAIPYLKRAALSKPTDPEVQTALGRAYAANGKTKLAVVSYSRAAQFDSGNADRWFHLGVTYLEQVESDARVLLARHKDSSYFQSLMAEAFAEQRAFIQAEAAYKKVLASPRFPPGTHAGYGLVLVNRHDLSAAERELRAEIAVNPGSLTAKLGIARLDLEQGTTVQAVKEIEEIEKADAGFLQANVSLFSTGMSRAKQAELRRALEEGQATGNVTEEVLTLFRDFGTGASFPGQSPERATVAIANRGAQVPVGAAVKLYANGSYGECDNVLGSRLQQLSAKNLQLLAWCAYLSGNYPNSLQAASKLASNPATEAEGLYWETKSAQKLATQALAKASAADPGSPTLHVLLGDIYRQQKFFPDAEQEYRKALALRPQDSGALFGLSLALLADGKNDEALNVTQPALQKNPDDPELNAVMGEILCVRDDFAGAEPYLKKSLNAKPEFVSRVHALLGKVYAQTNRIQQAIVELKLSLASDKDGSLHYQIARLYLKVGDPGSAKRAFEVSKRLQQEGLMHASVAMQQGENDNDSQ